MISDPKRTLVIISGPTAVGKTSLAIQLARHLKTEILSADSRQFYREMRIGTARPGDEELAQVHHHFIGHLSIHDRYNVSMYERDVLTRLDTLFENHDVVVMAGGSGLYIDAVCNGIDDLPDPDDNLRNDLKQLYEEEGIEALRARLHLLDPDYYQQVDLANPKRLLRALEVCITTGKPYSALRMHFRRVRDFNILSIGLEMERDLLNERINQRTDQMMEEGLLDEARELFPFRTLNALNTVGYKELFAYFDGKISLDEAVESIKTNSRRYAKRQITWFRRNPSIKWFHPDHLNDIITFVDNEINSPS